VLAPTPLKGVLLCSASPNSVTFRVGQGSTGIEVFTRKVTKVEASAFSTRRRTAGLQQVIVRSAAALSASPPNSGAAADAAERSGPLVLGHGSASRISLIESGGGRFALAVDTPRRRCGSIYLGRMDRSAFESGHVLKPLEAERAARKLLGIYKREAIAIAPASEPQGKARE
jgi:hypothetical protein